MTPAVGLHVEPDDLHQPDFGQLVAEFRLQLEQLRPGQGLGGASDRSVCPTNDETRRMWVNRCLGWVS